MAQASTERPPALQELKPGQQWVCFDKEKAPYNPATGTYVNGDLVAGNPTWGTYQQAVTAWKSNPEKYAGIGREFVREQGITGVDFDKCRDPQTGHIAEWAQAEIAKLNSYTEISPSGTGVHIWVRGIIPENIPPRKPEPDGYEMYDHERYFTITGKHLEGTPTTIEDRQAQLLDLHREIAARRVQAKRQAEAQRQAPARRMPTAQTGGDTQYGLAALENECHDMRQTGDGGRNDQLNRSAYALGQLISGGELTRYTVETRLSAAAAVVGLDDPEIERTMRSGIEKGMERPRSAPVKDHNYLNNISRHEIGQETTPMFVLDCLNMGEYGDGLLFAKIFRGKALFDHTAGEWYTWQQHYWCCDDTGRIKHYVSGMLASFYIRAAATMNEQEKTIDTETPEGKERLQKLKKTIGLLTKRALDLRHIGRCRNVLAYAASEPDMGIKATQWDTHKWLLPTVCGVIDLRTGELRDGRPDEYIRTVAPTEWRGLAEQRKATRWLRFLDEIFELKENPDHSFSARSEAERAALIGFLQRLLGYGLLGAVVDHIFAVFYGEGGRNGKDTIQHILNHILGALSAAIHNDVLLAADKGHSAGAPTPHISDLQGKRLAWASEPDEGARFSVGQVKKLTGGGAISTRGMWEKKQYSFEPSHLLILLTNHKPHANADDSAFWERLHLINFNMRFVDNPCEKNERKKEAGLWEALEKEASAILAWLVQGCLDWQIQGLNAPDFVLTAGKEYQQDEDPILAFLSECCVIRPDLKCKAGELYKRYETWAKDGNIKPLLNSTNFGRLMAKRHKKEKEGVMWYYGLALSISDSLMPDLDSSGESETTIQNGMKKLEKPNDGKSENPSFGQFGQFSVETPYIRDDSFQKMEVLPKTIQTIQTSNNKNGMNGLAKPDERVLDRSKNYPNTEQNYPNPRDEKTNDVARALLVEMASQGCSLRLDEKGSWGIAVPVEWSDEQFEALMARVLALDTALRPMFVDK